MKRPITLIASILSLLTSLLAIAFAVIIFNSGLDLLEEGNAFAQIGIILMTGFGGVPVLFGIFSMSFSIVAITSWNKLPNKFKRKKGKTIAAIVFNFLLIGVELAFLILLSELKKITIPICIAIVSVFFVVNILFIIDLSLEGRRTRKYNEKQEIINAELANKKLNDEKLAKQKELKDKIAKLDYMKTLGMITEQEMSELRKKYAQELINYL